MDNSVTASTAYVYNTYETSTTGACSGQGCCSGTTKYAMVQNTTVQYACNYLSLAQFLNVQVRGVLLRKPT